MAQGIYLKANGELPCWGHIGESLIHGQVDRAWLESDEGDLVGMPAIVGIRQAFAEGRLPFPSLCQHCVYLGAGVVTSLRPDHFDQILVEASYLCELDCPACISPKARLGLKRPPYYLDCGLFDAMLERLHREGIRSVRLFHFEGRGDPLLNREFTRLTRIAKRLYPEATTMVTTHGSYPFRPELLDCGLDVLRLSIDGANPESYAKYRRGGDFTRVIGWLKGVRSHRRRYRSRLQVVWKYILFEWNDDEAEIAAAARMADEFEAQILFVFSNSPGRSLRFTEPSDLAPILAEVAPRAQISGRRFPWNPLRPPERERQRVDECAAQLAEAIEKLRDGQRQCAVGLLERALKFDPGLPEDSPPIQVDERMPPARLLDWIVARTRQASTLSALAHLAEIDEHWRGAYLLQRRYLQIGPETPEREVFEGSLLRFALLARLGSTEPLDLLRCSASDLKETEGAILGIDPGHREGAAIAASSPPEDWLAEILLPETLRTLGFLRWAGRDLPAARTLFDAYLASGNVPDEAVVQGLLERIAAANRSLLERMVSRTKALLKTGLRLGLRQG